MVLPDIDLRLKGALDLPTVFAQQLSVLPQTDNATFKKAKSFRFRFRKESVLVFAQPARHVVELRIIAIERHRLLAQRVHLPAGRFSAIGKHLILEGFRLLLQLFQTAQISGNELLKKIMEDLPNGSPRPTFFLRDAMQKRRKRGGIVREDDTVLRNEQSKCGANAVLTAARKNKCPGQAARARLGSAKPCAAHRGRMLQNTFQSREDRALLQLLRREQNKRRNIRRDRGFRMYKRFPDTVPDHIYPLQKHTTARSMMPRAVEEHVIFPPSSRDRH